MNNFVVSKRKKGGIYNPLILNNVWFQFLILGVSVGYTTGFSFDVVFDTMWHYDVNQQYQFSHEK